MNKVHLIDGSEAHDYYLASEVDTEIAALETEKKHYGEMITKFIEFCDRHGLGKFGDNYSSAVLEYAEQLATVNELQARKLSALETEREALQAEVTTRRENFETAIQRLIATEQERDALMEILERIEFVGTDLFPECPVCRFEKPGHAVDCDLAAALARASAQSEHKRN